MHKVIRTDATNSDFINLVKRLDSELAIRDGEDHAFYHQFNGISNIRYAIVIYKDDQPVACGAIKEFDKESMEVKRMFTIEGARGNGFATKVLAALEKWTRELDYSKCVLETGKAQPEAISMYRKLGYIQIPNYGQYIGVDNSLCFEKRL